MARTRGGLSLLTVGAIFVVVFGTMQLGVQYSRGEVLQYDPPSGPEERLRADVRERIDAERADRGLGPARGDSSARAAAQETARWLAETGYFDDPTAAGVRPGANRSLPNRKGFCDRTPVKLAVDHPDWTVGGVGDAGEGTAPEGDGVPEAAVDHVGERAVELLSTAGERERPLFARSNDHGHGVGVAIDGDVVYVVYRTCNLGY